MPKQRTGARFRLGEPIDSELADFCEALPSASHTEIIRRAVSAYIRDFLSRNEGVREDYERLRRARREGRVSNVRVINGSKTED
jgi:hypothetical protein